MLTFIIPLKSRQVSKDWSLVSSYVNRTIKSILSQSNDSYRVILVCNERPENYSDREKVVLIEESFPIPEKGKAMKDKWDKVIRGLIECKKLGTDYVMIVDADDILSNKLVEFVMADSTESGWLIDKGYGYDEGSRFLLPIDDFNKLCGTSSIVKVDEEQLPSSMNESCFINENGHSEIDTYFEKVNRPLKKVPFRAVIYLTGTIENDSGLKFGDIKSRKKQLLFLFKRKRITNKILKEFELI